MRLYVNPQVSSIQTTQTALTVYFVGCVCVCYCLFVGAVIRPLGYIIHKTLPEIICMTEGNTK